MLTPKDNLCESCTNVGCIFQSGIVRKECAFYMPPHMEPDNCGNYLGVREFEEIVVNYPPESLCTYPEYKGKPYFGIKYKENGEEIVGYGTYKPEVLSRYLKDYFISTKKGDDCESDHLCTQRRCLKNHNVGIIECDEKYCLNRTKF